MLGADMAAESPEVGVSSVELTPEQREEIRAMKIALRMGFWCRAHRDGKESFCFIKEHSKYGYVCTRPSGHAGPHVAHHGDGSLCPVDPWF